MSLSQRGVSLLAALVFVGILSAVALGIEYEVTPIAQIQGQSQLALSSGTGDQPDTTTQPPAEEQAKEECSAPSPTGQKELDGKTIKKVGKYCAPSVFVENDIEVGVKANCKAVDIIPKGRCWVRYCSPSDPKKCQVAERAKDSVLTRPELFPFTERAYQSVTGDSLVSEADLKACGEACGGSPTGQGVNDAFQNLYGPSDYKGETPEAIDKALDGKYAASCSTIDNVSTCFEKNENADSLKELQNRGYVCNDAGDGTTACNKDLSDAKYLRPDDASKPLGSCSYGQVWISGTCYEYKGPATGPDNSCATGQVFVSNNCYTKIGPNAAGCATGQIKDPSGKCVPINTFQPPPDNRSPGPDGKNRNTNPRGGLGDILGKVAPLLGSFLKGLLQPQPQKASPQACPSDPNQYAQYQQQYQYQLQQYNYQLQQYNYQQQLSNTYGLGGPSLPPPVQPTPCTPSTAQQCSSQPPQPPPGNCTAGTWKPNYSGACITNWQCVPNSQNAPKAELSCEPKVADVGMTLAISYACSAGNASGSGFTVSAQPTGSATTTVAAPPAGTNTATYALTCNNGGVTAGAQCRVQIAVPTIILVANPKSLASGETSVIGWVTAGMGSCVVSSPTDSAFTARNSSNTSVAGTATTSPITTKTDYLLHCQTVGGGVRDATTTVSVL